MRNKCRRKNMVSVEEILVSYNINTNKTPFVIITTSTRRKNSKKSFVEECAVKIYITSAVEVVRIKFKPMRNRLRTIP